MNWNETLIFHVDVGGLSVRPFGESEWKRQQSRLARVSGGVPPYPRYGFFLSLSLCLTIHYFVSFAVLWAFFFCLRAPFIFLELLQSSVV